jgi:hypothetical protein
LVLAPGIDDCCARADLDFPNLPGSQETLVDQFKDLIIYLIDASTK